MTSPQNGDTAASLRDLLRRMVALSPTKIDAIVASCAEAAPRDIVACIRDYGPIAALVRLAPLFPEGYLEQSSPRSTSREWTDAELARVQLVRQLHRELPALGRAQRTTVGQSRLDDIVFREVTASRGGRSDRERTRLLQNLFRLYDVAPRLDRLQDLVSTLKSDVDLANAVVVAHQHLLGSVASQFEALWKLGLAPTRTYVIGKPYSTNRLVAAYLEERGCVVGTGFDAFDREATAAPDWYQTDHHAALGYFFARVVKSLPGNNVSRLIVLDDGGMVLSWLNRAFDTGLFSAAEMRDLARLEVVGVEQTTFGRHLIETLAGNERTKPKHRASVPVANVAQTRLKLEKESQLIARSVVHELGNWIRASDARESHVNNLDGAKLGVIGYGVVGAWVCHVLYRELGHQVLVFDDDISHISIARSSGYRTAQSVADLARECSIIIGCTGAAEGIALEADMIEPGTILASASSGNFEFARVFMSAPRERTGGINPELTPERRASSFDWLHSITAVPVNGGYTYVLNSGFPVNFTGAVDPIRADDIELTRCLMVLGVSSALRALPRRPNFGGTVTLARIDETLLTDMFRI